ncbi:hypothetical protein Dsin_032871 [Dipteronia sinensis]|uniref:PPIase cyclophilin-type domain-containing protein n=1 Tax=Dipteronia sinensis TaxID=43782 RepID=A0AAD9Z317_9ROSI|nr:hypothetical protein Dsin_032871 [Dipteronia sinensis]
MLQNQKLLQFSPILPPTPLPTATLQGQSFPSSPSLAVLTQSRKLSRRDLSISSNSSLLLLWGTQALEPIFNLSKARAEENLPNTNKNEQEENLKCTNKVATKQAFVDISIDGKPVGRIVIGLYGDNASAGVARFSSLVSGTAGISYRRKKFIKIKPNYVQHGGVRTYGVDAELASSIGSNLAVENLKEEWERNYEQCPGTKNLAGTVSIIVRDPSKPPPKLKLVARKGKLEIDQEEVGEDPNGTEFVIATKDSPELDASALVVGRVLEGMEVVEKGGKDNRRQKGCRGGKRLQPPLFEGGHHKLWLDGITPPFATLSCSFNFVL